MTPAYTGKVHYVRNDAIEGCLGFFTVYAWAVKITVDNASKNTFPFSDLCLFLPTLEASTLTLFGDVFG